MNLVRLGMPRLHADSQRPDRPGNQHFARSRIARLARNLYPAPVQPLYFITEPQRLQLEAIRSKRVGLDDLRAGFDVRLMDAEDGFGLGGIQLIEAALRAHRFVQHRTHRAIGDEDAVLDSFVEFLNSQGWIFLAGC